MKVYILGRKISRELAKQMGYNVNTKRKDTGKWVDGEDWVDDRKWKE